MLWIVLAVGSVLGIGVFLVIKLVTWSTTPSSRQREQLETSSTAQRAVTTDRYAPHAARRDAALSAVDDIKQEIGELRINVLWTITNSALWDMAVPESRSFFTALTVWDDHHTSWRSDDVVKAAGELKVLWKAAIDAATRLGINHLSAGDRPKADTAIKLVRKAASTPSEAERHQLMAKAAEVLSGIMSIAIPRETMREIKRGAAHPELTDPDDPSSAQPEGPTPH